MELGAGPGELLQLSSYLTPFQNQEVAELPVGLEEELEEERVALVGPSAISEVSVRADCHFLLLQPAPSPFHRPRNSHPFWH